MEAKVPERNAAPGKGRAADRGAPLAEEHGGPARGAAGEEEERTAH
eukprot:SAG22_NODE_20722_length_263_cov_0.634146_1_plen_45_part_10